MIAIVTCYVLILTEPRFEEGLDVFYGEVLSAKQDASFFVQSIQESGDDEPRVAHISSQFRHLNSDFDFAFAVLKECADEMLQPLSYII